MSLTKPYTPDGSTVTYEVPDYSDKPLGHEAFKAFAASFPDLGPVKVRHVATGHRVRPADCDCLLVLPDGGSVVVDASTGFTAGNQIGVVSLSGPSAVEADGVDLHSGKEFIAQYRIGMALFTGTEWVVAA